jgi:hypothetical protein
MQSVARFRVVSPFIAVQGPTNKERVFTVPVGAVIETSSPDLHEPGLVTVTWNGERLVVFRRDLREHAELIEDRSSSMEA